MARDLSRCFFLVLVLGLAVHFGAPILHAQDESKGRPPAGRNGTPTPDADLENAATNYVERRKQAEGAAARQRASAGEARAAAGMQRQQAEQPASDSQRAKRSEISAELTDTPKTMFAITLWTVRLNESDKDKNGEDSKLALPPRTEFPTEFGSLDSVRALINGLSASGRVRSSRELRVLALDGQSARVQVGGNRPQVTGVTTNSMGRSNMVTYRSIGKILQAKPHVDSEKRIQVEIQYSMSDMEPSNDVPIYETSDGKSKVSAEMEVVQELQTTAKVKNGAAVLIKCDSTSSSAGKQTDLVIIGCETVPAPE